MATTQCRKSQEQWKSKPICTSVTTSKDTLSVLADAALATSNTTQPNNPTKFLPDLVTQTVDEADCPCEN